MTQYDGSIPVTGTITTTDTEDGYATHLDELGKGGYRVVDTLVDRDAISTDRRTEGMLVYVLEDSEMYQLIGGTDNVNWLQPVFDTLSDLTDQYIFRGDANGNAVESADLIDVELDILSLNQQVASINGSTPLLKDSSTAFPAAQVVSDMQPGFLFHANAGNLISLSVLTNDHLPGLAEGHVRVGNSLGRPDQVPYELNTIPANGDVDLNGFKAINSAAPVNGGDLINKDYADSLVVGGGSTTLTGAVTGSGTGTINTTLTPITASQVSDFDSVVTSYRLNEFAAPNTNVSFNSQRVINLSNGVDPQDGVTKFQLDNIAQALINAPFGCLTVNNFPNNLILNAGEFTPTHNLPYTLATSSRFFDLLGASQLRCLYTDTISGISTYFKVSISLEVFYSPVAPTTSVTFEIVKNETLNLIKPRYTVRLEPGTDTVINFETEPVSLNNGETVCLYVRSSANTGFLNIRNLTLYATKL